MAGDTDNPRIWLNADVYAADTDHGAAPTDVTSALNAAFEALGLLSEDGMTEGREEEQTDHYAYGGILVRTTRSKHKRTFVVTALENTPVVFDLVNPGSTAATNAGVTTRTIKVPTTTPNRKSFVLHHVDGDTIRRRYIPTGEVTEVGEVSITDNEMEAFELTITVYPDADGVLYEDISNDPSWDDSSS